MPVDYEKKKAEARERSKAISLQGRDIAPIPSLSPKSKKRRKGCALDFKRYCETYYPSVFNLAWSSDHLSVIAKIQASVLDGGLFAIAMPRGSGKTSLCTAGAEWALLYGHRAFVVLIGATERHAEKLLDNIKADLETNDLLNEDFPEVCYPLRRIGGIKNRAAGQLLNGESTNVSSTAKELVLPTVPKSCASGSRVEVAGITGSFRGMASIRPSDGAKIRPDLVLIDDPQTDESAKSPKQVRERLSVLMGAILGLAGPKKKIAGIMPVTVISKGDVADQVLDRKLHPEWQGQRTKLLRTMPKNVKLWEQYAEIRAKSLAEERGIADATAFYLANRSAMDDGAEAAWEARYNADEISAVQNAMNLKLTDEVSFMAEYQNEPLSFEDSTPLILRPEQVAAKAIDLDRGVVPNWASKLTAFADVQGSVLFYTVVAYDQDFSAHIVDYGAYPDQAKAYYFLREVSPTLQQKYPNVPHEGQLYKGFEELTDKLLGRLWDRENGATPIKIDRMVIDAGYSTAVVQQFCSRSKWAGLLLPSKGRGVTADIRPMSEWGDKAGNRKGWNWRVVNVPERHLQYDTNAWKTFVAERIITATGSKGALSMFKGSANLHRLFTEHVTSEYPTPTEGQGRTVNIWKPRPNRENHWLDCLVGCFVAASEQGVLAVGHNKPTGAGAKPRRKLDVNF